MISSRLYAIGLAALMALAVGCTGSAHRTSAPITVSAQPASSATQLPYGPPREIDVVETSPITYSDLGDGLYSFSYSIKNVGLPACMARVFVILHRLDPEPGNADTDTNLAVCLASGETYSVSVEARLAAGSWGFGAQWSSTPAGQPGMYHCYSKTTDCHPEDLPTGRRISVS